MNDLFESVVFQQEKTLYNLKSKVFITAEVQIQQPHGC